MIGRFSTLAHPLWIESPWFPSKSSSRLLTRIWRRTLTALAGIRANPQPFAGSVVSPQLLA